MKVAEVHFKLSMKLKEYKEYEIIYKPAAKVAEVNFKLAMKPKNTRQFLL